MADGTGICLYCIYWHLGILFSLDVYLAQSGCSLEGLGLSTGQGALPSLMIGGGGERVCEGSGRGMGLRKEVRIWIDIFK